VQCTLVNITFTFSIRWRSSELLVLLGQSLVGGSVDVGLKLLLVGGVDGGLGGSQNMGLNKHQVGVVGQAAEQPDEGLLELVVGLGRDIVILQVLLAVEGDLLRLNLAVLHIDLVADEHDGDVLADTSQVLVPLGHVRVGNAGADIEHDDTAVSTDVVAVTKTAELLLTGSVPDVELDLAVISEEGHGVHLHTKSSDVLLLELTSQVALHEGSLASTAVTDEHKLEFRNLLLVNPVKN